MAKTKRIRDRRTIAVRVIAVLPLLIYCYIAVAVTLANVAARRVPTVALSLWPSHAEANLRSAEDFLQLGGSRASIDRASARARKALLTDPTSAEGLRILAVGAATRNDRQKADVLFGFAEKLSRRDLQTQLWEIEQRVRENDVSGALQHYAIALRVSPEAEGMLFPPLAGALVHRELTDPVADLVSSEDSWRNAFLTYLVGNASDPATASSFFSAVANRHVRLPGELVQLLIPRLLAKGQLNEAARLYTLVDVKWRADSAAAQLNGDFSRREIPPFGWEIEDGSTFVGPRKGGSSDNALQAMVEGSEPVTIARKLMLLRPGRYRLSGSYHLGRAEQKVTLRVALSCDGNAEAPAGEAILTGGASQFASALAAPSCRATWLTIAAVPTSQQPVRFWIDQLQLQDVGGT